MIIELWRKMVATDASARCAVCGNGFELGSVYPAAMRDDGDGIGELCPVCLDYLGRRKRDAEDPASDSWPAREWPTLEDLEEARRNHPEAMFETEGDLIIATYYRDSQAKVYRDSVVWRTEPEKPDA